jgi:hypothetical protein
MIKRFGILASLCVMPGLLPPTYVKAQPSWSQVGVLNCTLAPSIGLIIMSQQRMG